MRFEFFTPDEDVPDPEAVEASALFIAVPFDGRIVVRPGAGEGETEVLALVGDVDPVTVCVFTPVGMFLGLDG